MHLMHLVGVEVAIISCMFRRMISQNEIITTEKSDITLHYVTEGSNGK
jgi:hypothetical protein